MESDDRPGDQVVRFASQVYMEHLVNPLLCLVEIPRGNTIKPWKPQPALSCLAISAPRETSPTASADWTVGLQRHTLARADWLTDKHPTQTDQPESYFPDFQIATWELYSRVVHALEKEMATHSGVLAWRIPGTGEPGGLPSTGSHRVGHD